ncbi:LysR family transcriptional regulator [Aquamicrobium sp. LC103]|uniref:LysR family transcriptional regulator n=1 Tax=Aquamicrobium sp. LC103 TaxID=1120658 RepID=UPI00063E7AF3|nr:LysR family transcriptional regulator [Aquamicrobium sp. LC103]TKT74464.1 LysR family transcriptional regulator [Aquamicrobium sp. LC103]
MEIKWLEDFVALADASSFSRAAELRNVTQSAFSRRIRQLEAWLGVTLISRATMPAELTPEGRSFLPVAQETIRTFYTMRETLRPAPEARLIRIAALHTLTLTFFPDWLGRLESIAGPLGTAFIPDRGGIEANVEAMVMDEADLFLTYAHPEVPFHLDRDKFEYLTIGRDRLIPVAAPQVRIADALHPGAGILDRAVSGELVVPCLSYGYSSFFGVALAQLLAKRPPFGRRTVHENTISAGLKTVALTGSGLCWLPESLVAKELADGRLVAASASREWLLDLEIRLYRHSAKRMKAVETMWDAAAQIRAALTP